MSLIDTHCHIYYDKYKDDLSEVIDRSIKHNISIGTVTDLIKYRLKNYTIVERISKINFDSYFGGNFDILTFKNRLSNEEHYALVSKNLDNK